MKKIASKTMLVLTLLLAALAGYFAGVMLIKKIYKKTKPLTTQKHKLQQ